MAFGLYDFFININDVGSAVPLIIIVFLILIAVFYFMFPSKKYILSGKLSKEKIPKDKNN